jgi:sugar lactone lactonase YvrE
MITFKRLLFYRFLYIIFSLLLIQLFDFHSDSASSSFFFVSSKQTYIRNLVGSYYTSDRSLSDPNLVMSPSGLWCDSSRNLTLYADAVNCLIRVVEENIQLVKTLVGTGVCGYNGDNLPGTSTMINFPQGIAVDTAGNLYFADSSNNLIRRYSFSTHLVTIIAGNLNLYGSNFLDGVVATATTLKRPTSVWVSSNSIVYIGDTNNYRIRKVSLFDGIIRTYAGTGVPGCVVDGLPAINASFTVIADIFGDSSGNHYVSDAGCTAQIRKINSGSSHEVSILTPTFSQTAGIWVTSTNYLYLADMGSNQIWRIDLQNNFDLKVGDGTGIGGPTENDIDATAYARLDKPVDVCVNSQQSVIYLSQQVNRMINKVILSTNKIYNYIGSNPQQSYYGDGRSLSDVIMSQPLGLWGNTKNNILYFADSGNLVIRYLSLNSSNPAVHTLGKADGSGSYSFAKPYGISGDTNGVLYITDKDANVVYRLIPGAASGSIIAGTAYNGGACTNYLKSPTGVFADKRGKILSSFHSFFVLAYFLSFFFPRLCLFHRYQLPCSSTCYCIIFRFVTDCRKLSNTGFFG